jgi:hypothetical protein
MQRPGRRAHQDGAGGSWTRQWIELGPLDAGASWPPMSFSAVQGGGRQFLAYPSPPASGRDKDRDCTTRK